MNPTHGYGVHLSYCLQTQKYPDSLNPPQTFY